MTSKAIPLPKLSGFTERDGNWYAEEIPLADLAKEFGTPLYIYSKKALTEAYQAYDKACVDSNGKRRARVHSMPRQFRTNVHGFGQWAKKIIKNGELTRP